MSWIALVTMLLEVLGPILKELIEKWLNKAVKGMPAIDGEVSQKDLEAVWQKVLTQVPRINFVLRSLVRAAAKVSMDRLPEINLALAAGRTRLSPLATDEAKAIAGSITTTVGSTADTSDVL